MAQLFFLVSGENPTLPFSEVKAILEAEGFQYQVVEELTQILRVETSPDCIKPLKFRSALARVFAREIFCCEAEIEEILENIQKADFASFIGEEQRFVVRVKRVKERSAEINGWMLEQKIGEALLQEVNSKVSLKAADRTFFGVLTGNRFIFGLKEAEVTPGQFLKRGPRKKVFFHPSAMPAKLARCMVNLAQPRRGELVLDPFCGTGSFLVEAGLMGQRVMGFDVKRNMVKGTLQNLALYGIDPEGMVISDARCMPLDEAAVDCVVTDPPYGTSATTLGTLPKDLIQSFLSTFSNTVKKGRRICLAAPKSLKIHEMGLSAGLKHLESHFIYFHRSLTREIAVFEVD